MRISAKDYIDLQDMLDQVVDRLGVAALKDHKASLANDPRVKNIDKRFRWDLLYATSSAARTNWFDNVYAYGADDTHVDTALKVYTKARHLN